MEVLAVTAARFQNNRLVALMLGRVDGSRNLWVEPAKQVEVIEVVDALHRRDTVTTIFKRDGNNVPGPFLKVVADAHGEESVDLTDTSRYQLTDLPKF